MSSTGVFLFAAAFASAVLLAGDPCSAPLPPAEQRAAKVRELGRTAQSDMAAGRFPDAVGKLKEAACLAPESSRVLYDLGVAQAASGDFARALSSLQASHRLQPTSKLPLAMQVRVNFSLHDQEAMKANLREAASRFPQDTELHSALARFLTENRLYDLALAESLRARKGSDANARIELAGLENTATAYDDAIRNATQVESDAAIASSSRASAAGIAGLSFEAIGQREEAIRHLRHAVQLDPSKENSYLALADLLEQSQQSSDAVAVLKDAQREIPSSRAFLLPLGMALVHAEKYQEGITVLRDVIQAAPNEDQAYLNIAAASRNSGDVAGEIQILEALEKRLPQYPMIHVLLARALLNAEPVDAGRVQAQLAAAQNANPDDADLFYLKGKVALAANHLDEARLAFERAIQLRPLDPSAYYQLGRLYQKMNQPQLAKDNLERAVLLGSNISK